MTDYDEYWEHFDDLKSQRPICGDHDNDWEHSMVSYESENYKECSYCGYQEDIEVKYD